ncbi:esterase-like activity of phytase, partial [Escherichia coli]|nr:esterase-like activity of phytase [Escherichia coli]
MKRKPLIAFFIAIFIALTISILFPFNCTYKKSPQ